MLSLTYNKHNRNLGFYYEVHKEIESLKSYFQKFCKQDADYYMTEAYLHTIENYDESKGSLNSYIKALARTMPSNAVNEKEVLVDFSDKSNTQEYDSNSYYVAQAHKSKEQQEVISLENTYATIDDAIFVLKTEYPAELIYFQRAIQKGTVYGDASKNFKLLCTEIIRQYPELIETVKDLDLTSVKQSLGLVL